MSLVPAPVRIGLSPARKPLLSNAILQCCTSTHCIHIYIYMYDCVNKLLCTCSKSQELTLTSMAHAYRLLCCATVPLSIVRTVRLLRMHVKVQTVIVSTKSTVTVYRV